MMPSRLAATAISGSLLVTLAGCSFTFTPERLKTPHASLSAPWVDKSFEPSKFGKVVVLPVGVDRTETRSELEAQQVEECRSILQSQLEKAFATALGTGDRTLYVGAEISRFKRERELPEGATWTHPPKPGYGIATCTMFAKDGQNGPRVAFLIQITERERDFSVETTAGDWAGDFREMLGSGATDGHSARHESATPRQR
jgi:hypothetical protein